MANGSLQRFLGGSPLSVLVKLIFLSILVGAIMAFLGITPLGLVDGIVDFIRRVIGRGFEAVREVGQWLLYGAVIVVPVWLIVRLFGRR
ncbi:DUF6460 domain-containing protein [Chelatococcus composti]|jgi:hypothetical protein|uniref:DUF6460 domain-containing protein n=1 Tax=Chelatococcus composti TaxID=1743235 RepID=A0A841K339_9HYPH|nr:DUF6460 domain-containing protein [Chelatococcus composti]MBB6167178.1 hypothetical protein [Chelatococcus composti]MBS7735387.1 integrase [Chelatococcus composti]PZN41317.1 MAG: integrase [Pseudomonadota bacterium]GGG29888.1 hypothetical protein GCM10008026_07940 [Chelatococcus composti]